MYGNLSAVSSETRGCTTQDRFEELRDRIESKGRNPGITNFIRVREQPFLQEYLGRCGTSRQEILFLTKELPGGVIELRDARNQA